MCVRACMCMRECPCTCARARVYMHVGVCACSLVRTRAYLCLHVYAYTGTCVHACTWRGGAGVRLSACVSVWGGAGRHVQGCALVVCVQAWRARVCARARMYVRALAPVCMHVCLQVPTRVCAQACVQASECACMGVPRLGVRRCVHTPVHACARVQWCRLVCPYDLQPLLLLPGAHPLRGCMWGAHTTLAPTPLPGKPKTGNFFFFPQQQPSRAALPLFLGRKRGGLGGFLRRRCSAERGGRRGARARLFLPHLLSALHHDATENNIPAAASGRT